MVDWITISNNSGNSGTTVITVTAATYDELITRTTSLVVNTVNTSLSGSVSISQEPRPVETVSVSPSTISAPKEGGAYSFNIISNGAWVISYPDEWITISQSAGTGNATITVDVAQNLILSGKTGNIEVSTRDNTAIVAVTQERNTGYINVEPSVLEFVYSGGSRAVVVSSNTDWTISNIPNWVTANTLSGTGDNTVIFTITGTPSSDRTSVIKFSVLDEDAYLTIRQSSTIPYLYFENSAMTFSNAGGTQINRVNSNVQWEMEVIEELTFEIISGGTIVWDKNNVEYKLNNDNWITKPSSIEVSSGDIVKFRGNNTSYNSYYSGGISGTAYFNLKGNIMSLISSTNYNSATLTSDSTFYSLFSGSNVIDAGRLLLPATTLRNSCYSFMFSDCVSLTVAPALPATTLEISCYSYMFAGCVSLTSVPDLPATNLFAASGCYNRMFSGCTSLTTAPALPATTLASNCYQQMFAGCVSLLKSPLLPASILKDSCYNGMFSGCSNLNYIECLATSISAISCTTNWVNGVSESGTFVKNTDMTGWTTGNNGIPNNWTIEDV